MTDPSGGIPFVMQNLQEGDRYIKKGNILLPCPSLEKPEDILKLPADEEVITVLGKQWARLVLEYDFSIVRKSGHGVRPSEAEAMRLVSKHTSVPVPEVIPQVSVMIMEGST
jgi:hypothetical protein